MRNHALLLGQKECNYLTDAMADQSPSDASSSQGERVKDTVQEDKAVRFSPEEEAVRKTDLNFNEATIDEHTGTRD